VDDQQVGLVAGDREHRRVARVGLREHLPVVQERFGFVECRSAVAFRGVPPRVPVHGAEVVEREPALLCLRGVYHVRAFATRVEGFSYRAPRT